MAILCFGFLPKMLENGLDEVLNGIIRALVIAAVVRPPPAVPRTVSRFCDCRTDMHVRQVRLPGAGRLKGKLSARRSFELKPGERRP